MKSFIKGVIESVAIWSLVCVAAFALLRAVTDPLEITARQYLDVGHYAKAYEVVVRLMVNEALLDEKVTRSEFRGIENKYHELLRAKHRQRGEAVKRELLEKRP